MLHMPLSELIKEENFKKLKELDHVKYRIKIRNLYEQEMKNFQRINKEKEEEMNLLFEASEKMEKEFNEYVQKWNESANQYLENMGVIAAEIEFSEKENEVLNKMQANVEKLKLQKEYSQEAAKEFKEVLKKTNDLLKDLITLKPAKQFLTKQYSIASKRQAQKVEMQYVGENRFLSSKLLKLGNQLTNLYHQFLVSSEEERQSINEQIKKVEAKKDKNLKRLYELPKIYQLQAYG